MIYINNITFCTIILLFPLLAYFLYLQFYNNNNKQDNLMFSLAIYIAAYLVLTINEIIYPRLSLLSLNILIVLFYSKDKYIDAIFLSIIFILICYFNYKISLFIIIIEYLSFFILYIIKKIYLVSNYVYAIQYYIIKIIIYISRMNAPGCFFDDSLYEDKLIITFIFVIILNFIVLYVMEIEYKIINYHISYQELLKEKKLRLSLFKITHEIKNPLAVCKGYLSLLNCKSVKNKRYVSIIKSEIDDTISIIEDISNFSKLKIEKKYINVSDALIHTISNYEKLLTENNICLIKDIKENIYINCDENRLKQVLINMIKNSMEALKPKEYKKLHIILTDTKKYLNLKIIDNGKGINTKDLKKIGEPFFTTKNKGTGLGVALSKEIIEAHNGKMTFQSKLNEGTIVNIKIKK